MSLIKMMLVMVSVAAISKTFGLLGFLLRLSFLAKRRLLPHLLTLWVCKLLMLICILTKKVITSCSVTMMLFLHRSEERFSRNAETDLVCRLQLEKKTGKQRDPRQRLRYRRRHAHADASPGFAAR